MADASLDDENQVASEKTFGKNHDRCYSDQPHRWSAVLCAPVVFPGTSWAYRAVVAWRLPGLLSRFSARLGP